MTSTHNILCIWRSRKPREVQRETEHKWKPHVHDFDGMDPWEIASLCLAQVCGCNGHHFKNKPEDCPTFLGHSNAL